MSDRLGESPAEGVTRDYPQFFPETGTYSAEQLEDRGIDWTVQELLRLDADEDAIYDIAGRLFDAATENVRAALKKVRRAQR